MSNNPTMGVNNTTVSPPQGEIADQQLNNISKPQPTRLSDVNVIDAPKTDISTLDVPDIGTLAMTLGSQRPIQGYVPIGDIPFAVEWNKDEATFTKFTLPHDQEQLHVALWVKGTNVFNPLSLPPVPTLTSEQRTAITEDMLAEEFFGANGPSIATPGSAKRAAVEQSMSTMRSVIVNAFNRDIPFTTFGPAQRALALAAYEQELCKLQLFFQALDTVRGVAAFFAKVGTATDDSWLPLYSPNLYTSLVALYNSVSDLLVYDSGVHKRIEKLARPYAACERNAVPAGLMMQDAFIAQNKNYGVLQAATGGAKVDITPLVPNISVSEWWTIFFNEEKALNAIQTLMAAAKRIRTAYEPVITALNQCVSKGMLEPIHLASFIPAEPTPLGVLAFADSEPEFSYAFHERFEYAPERIVQEVGSDDADDAWSLFDLPFATGTDNVRRSPASCMGLRPVGLKCGDEGWKVSELLDVGLFKLDPTNEFAQRLSKMNLNNLTNVAGLEFNLAYSWVDAVFGDFYFDALTNAGATMRGLRHALYGLSFFDAGSGLHTMLPAMRLLEIYPAIPSGSIPFTGYMGSGILTLEYAKGNPNPGEIAAAEWLIAQLATQFDLSLVIVNRENGAGVTAAPMVYQGGYRGSGFYSFSLAAVDNAVGAAYLTLIPEMRYKQTPRKA